MERTARRMRQIVMMNQRSVRGFCGFGGLAGAGLLVTGLVVALAGCGSVVASDGAAAPAAPAAPVAPAASTTDLAAASAVGCASVNQATSVSLRRQVHLMVPVGKNFPVNAIYRDKAKVRALFGQMCAAVTHPAPIQVMHCPADLGTEYLGTFYDGKRILATFTYTSTGCQRISVTAAGKTQVTMVYGRAAAAAPHLAADLAALIGQDPSVEHPQGSVNPGGPDVPAQGA
jgi:hypothetical protein